MNTIYLYIFSLFGTLLPTFVGSFLPFLFKKPHPKLTSFFMTFSVGTIISLLFMELIPHSLEHSDTIFSNQTYGILLVLSIIFITGLIFFLLHELMHKITHHHNHDKEDTAPCHDHIHSNEMIIENKITLTSSLIYLFAIFIHNIPEGFVLGTLFTSEGFPLSGLMMTISLFIHNLIIGYSISSSFKKSNKGKLFSILLTSLNGLISYILSIVGYYFSISFPDLVTTIIFAISSGSLLYVLLIELLPSIFYEYKNKYTFLILAFSFILSTFLLLL